MTWIDAMKKALELTKTDGQRRKVFGYEKYYRTDKFWEYSSFIVLPNSDWADGVN
jgi:hypothetical protein